MRSICLAVLSMVLLLTIFPSCTQQAADEIFDRLIPSCAYGVKNVEQTMDVMLKAYPTVQKVEYGNDGRSERHYYITDSDKVDVRIDIYKKHAGNEPYPVGTDYIRANHISKDFRKVSILKKDLIIIEAQAMANKNFIGSKLATKTLGWDDLHWLSSYNSSNDALYVSYIASFILTVAAKNP